MYRWLVRPILFLLDPEKVHHGTTILLRAFFKVPFMLRLTGRICAVNDPSLEREFCGMRFPHPVGLAAGMDKDARLIREFAAFGFSFIEIGTVTPLPQPGNPRPRLFRIPADRALINRMGFNNQGVAAAAARLRNIHKPCIVGGNIGKNTLTPNEDAPYDYLKCFSALYDYVDYFVVNVSCPNVKDLRKLQDTDALGKILSAVCTERAKQSTRKPILLKISPDLTNNQIDEALSLIKEHGIDGVVATNTTTSRAGLSLSREQIALTGSGGLSGHPLRDRSTEVIRYIHQKTSGTLPIIGVGGIMSAQDALEKLEAGATLIQVYSGFVYQGPGWIRKLCRQISRV
jgi:dihydroorotate dehydrogenase